MHNYNQMKYIKTNTISKLLFLGIIISLLTVSLPVHAQSSDISDSSRESFNKLCDALKEINTTNSKKMHTKNCKSYSKLNSQTAAVSRICKTYSNRLKNQCLEYKSTTPIEDDAVSCAKDGGKDCDLVAKYVNPFIVFLSAAVGIAVTIGIISGGINYASAGSDPQKVSKGKHQIQNALLALLAYIFLYAFIKWMVPGTG